MTIRFLKQYGVYLILFVVSFFTWAPLLQPGFFSFHDFQHVARLFAMDKALWAGQFPVRFVSGLGFGYGYALYNFYPPFVYYLGELFHLFGASFVDSIKLVWATALIGSGLTMYFLGKEFWGKSGGFLSAVLYLYIPYHAVDAYVRGALAELFTFVWLPLILLFSYKLIHTSERKYLLWTGVILALLMITHNLIFLPFFGLFTLWFFALCILHKRPIALLAVHFTLSVLVCFGLSAFFWLPALAEKQFTLVDQILLKNLASYQIHFVCPEQLWNSLWGYGGSTATCLDGLSFKIGKIHLLLGVGTILAVLIVTIKQKSLGKKSRVVILSLALGLFSAFMTTGLSAPLWTVLSPLWYLQFPWRFLVFVALFLCLAIGILPSLFKWQAHRYMALVLLVGLVVWHSAKTFQPQTYFPDWNDDRATNNREIMERVSSSSFEYLPKGVATHFDDKGDLKVNVSFDLRDRYELYIANDQAKTEAKIIFPNSWRVRVVSPEPTTVRFPIAVFPGWRAYVDGVSTPIETNNDLKLLTVPVAKGTHDIIVNFQDTPVRTVANLLTLSTTLAVVAALYGSRRSQT